MFFSRERVIVSEWGVVAWGGFFFFHRSVSFYVIDNGGVWSFKLARQLV